MLQYDVSTETTKPGRKGLQYDVSTETTKPGREDVAV